MSSYLLCVRISALQETQFNNIIWHEGHYKDQSVNAILVIDICFLCQLLRNKWMHSVNRMHSFLIVAQAMQVTSIWQKDGRHFDIVWL
jgi:hypothetical protein